MMMIFFAVDISFQIPLEWKQRLLTKCDSNLSFMSFTNASLIEGGAIGLFYGAYLGILNIYASGQVFKPLDTNDIFKTSITLLIALALMLPFVLPIILVIGTQNPYLAFFFYTLMPTIGGGLSLYGLMDRVMDYLSGLESKQTKQYEQVSSDLEMKMYVFKV
jgi:hypothetical protein